MMGHPVRLDPYVRYRTTVYIVFNERFSLRAHYNDVVSM